MSIRTAVMLAGLALCGSAYAATNFSLPSPVKAGNIALAAGEYKVDVKGSIAVITDEKTNKSFTTMVKTESAEKKFNDTTVETRKVNGETKLYVINVGGSTTKLVFD